MTAHVQYTPGSANAAQICQLWSAHVDALERHLSTNTWVLAAVTVLLIAYPMARVLIPAVLHDIVPMFLPNVVRTVLKLI